MLLLGFLASCALAQMPAAELTVRSYGAQRLDLATGETVLEDGGEVVDQRSGVRLSAAWIAYVDGERLEARDAVVAGELGEVRADVVTIDLDVGRLVASGNVRLRRPGLAASSDRFGLDAAAGLAWLDGSVAATAPDAHAAWVWIDVADGRLALVGPYRFVDGGFVLSGDVGARLQLQPVTVDGAVAFDASTDVDEDLAGRMAAVRAALDQPPE